MKARTTVGTRRGRAILATLFFLLPTLGPSPGVAESRAVELWGQAGLESPRVALLIGNQHYARGPLQQPHQDVERLEVALRKAGFKDVLVVKDARTNFEFEQAGNRLRDVLSQNPRAVVFLYYSGHAVQLKGANYLVPTQARTWSNVSEAMSGSYALRHYFEVLAEYGAGLQLVFLDACRNNPFLDQMPAPERSVAANGLANEAYPPPGQGAVKGGEAVAWGQKRFARVPPGQTAPDDGMFSERLAQWIVTPGSELGGLMRAIGPQIRVGSLIPWEEGYVEGEFFFTPPQKPPETPAGRSRLEQLGGSWVTVPGGRFWRGSDDGNPDELPRQEVSVPSFQISRTEVTMAQYRACVEAEACSVTGLNAAPYCSWGRADRAEHAMNCVDWSQARAFAQWVGGRLPSEAEWEYAALAGTSQRYAGTDVQTLLCVYGNVADQEASTLNHDWTVVPCNDGYPSTAPVGRFRPNAWGLQDMSGNVAEWVDDCYLDSYRGVPLDGSSYSRCEPSSAHPMVGRDKTRHVIRGGGWSIDQDGLRVTERGFASAGYRGSALGIRVVREAPSTTRISSGAEHEE